MSVNLIVEHNVLGGLVASPDPLSAFSHSLADIHYHTAAQATAWMTPECCVTAPSQFGLALGGVEGGGRGARACRG